MIYFRLDGFTAKDGMGLVPSGEVTNPPSGLRWRRKPQLSEENVRDLLFTKREVLQRILGVGEFRAVRELYRADIVVVDDSERAHVVELKHHHTLPADRFPCAQVVRHRRRARASLCSAVRAKSTLMWVLTSRQGPLAEVETVPLFKQEEVLKVNIRRFAELTEASGDADAGPTWLAFETGAGRLVATPPASCPSCTTPRHERVVGMLENVCAAIQESPHFKTKLTKEHRKHDEHRRMWALHLVDEQDLYVTLEYYSLEGGPFIALACSAAIADCVAMLGLANGPQEPDSRCRTVATAVRAVVQAGHPDGWSEPVEHDDGLLRWFFTPLQQPKRSDEQGQEQLVETGLTWLGQRFAEGWNQ